MTHAPTHLRHKPSWMGVRERIIIALLGLTSAALLLAGVTAYSLERRNLDVRLTNELSVTAQKFAAMASESINPRTGKPYTSASDILQVAVAQTVPSPNEGVLGLVDGQVRWVAPAGVRVRLESDPELVQAVTPASRGQTNGQALASLKTEHGRYRYLVVPVEGIAGSPPGALVAAYDLAAEHRLVNRTYITYALVSLAVLVAIALSIWILVGRLLEPITSVVQTAQEITENDLTRRIPIRGNDELSRLTHTVNDMLDRLQVTFEEQRQLLDDVAHELRTPITIMRGHLELMDPTDPDDARTTRALSLDELDRMRRLVDDLLTLATAHRPDFVRPAETDVAQLTDEALDKARPLGRRQWQLDDLADTTAELDAQRITQALLQLASNAVKYSTEGSVIGIGSRVDGPNVRIWIRDEGYGIPLAEQQQVLTRFGRGSLAERRGIEGAGLGLAIVSSIAEAHHGSLELASAPGRGSTFTLVVPRRQQVPVPEGAP